MMPTAPARLPRWRRRKAWRALAEFLLYALIFAAWACWFGLRPAPPADPEPVPPPHLSSPQGPPGPRLSCGQGDMPPRIRCESYAVLASLPTWRVYCPGEARGGRVCDMERGVVVYPTLPQGAGWVWVEMTYDGGALAVRGQWVGERVRWAR